MQQIPEFKFEDFGYIMSKQKSELVMGTPTWYALVSRDNRLKKDSLKHLKMAMSGGDSVDEKTRTEINEFLKSHGAKCIMTNGHGMSELGGSGCYQFPGHENGIGVGVPSPYDKYVILDNEGNIVGKVTVKEDVVDIKAKSELGNLEASFNYKKGVLDRKKEEYYTKVKNTVKYSIKDNLDDKVEMKGIVGIDSTFDQMLGYSTICRPVLEYYVDDKTTIDEAGVKSLLDSTGGKININGKHNTTNFKDQKIIALVSKNEDEGQEAALKTYYMPVSGVYYVVGASLPGTITQAKIKESGFAEVTIDETVQDADKIVLPVHAQSLILEVEHKTSDNSPIGIFYANEFNQLGLLLSGLKTKETNGTNTFNDASVGNSVYTSSNGVYKQTMADSLATSTAAFHSLSQSIIENEKLTPSCFYAAESEKPVFLSNVSETRLIEVPLHKSNYNSLKHFSLRFANIKPTTPNAKNSLVLRVIGYRA